MFIAAAIEIVLQKLLNFGIKTTGNIAPKTISMRSTSHSVNASTIKFYKVWTLGWECRSQRSTTERVLNLTWEVSSRTTPLELRRMGTQTTKPSSLQTTWMWWWSNWATMTRGSPSSLMGSTPNTTKREIRCRSLQTVQKGSSHSSSHRLLALMEFAWIPLELHFWMTSLIMSASSTLLIYL